MVYIPKKIKFFFILLYEHVFEQFILQLRQNTVVRVTYTFIV